eukprot:473271-Rhodomonas_salina.3
MWYTGQYHAEPKQQYEDPEGTTLHADCGQNRRRKARHGEWALISHQSSMAENTASSPLARPCSSTAGAPARPRRAQS